MHFPTSNRSFDLPFDASRAACYHQPWSACGAHVHTSPPAVPTTPLNPHLVFFFNDGNHNPPFFLLSSVPEPSTFDSPPLTTPCRVVAGSASLLSDALRAVPSPHRRTQRHPSLRHRRVPPPLFNRSTQNVNSVYLQIAVAAMYFMKNPC